jgi:hypothetical protein
MAFHVWTGQQIRDTAGAPVNGGKLRIYTANTTSLANVYSDTAQTVPLVNPVAADSLGYLPDIFLSDSTNYDCAELTAGGVVIRAYDDVPAVGSDGSTFVKDFTGSRFQLRNSAGVLQMETGDPVGDNSGGKGRLGGWAGTQGDELEIDYGSTTITGSAQIDGTLTVGGSSVALDNVIASGTATASSTLDIPLTGSLQRYTLELLNLTVSGAGVTLQARFAFDGVPTFKTGVTEYGYTGDSLSGAPGSAISAGASSIVISGGSTIDSADKAVGIIEVFTPPNNTGSHPTWLKADILWDIAGANNIVLARTAGSCGSTFGEATYIRLFASSGTISCKWKLKSGRGLE